MSREFPQRFETHVTVEAGGVRPDSLLSGASGLSKSQVKRVMDAGAVWLTRGRRTQRLRRASRTLRAGEELHLYYDAAILTLAPPTPDLIHDAGQYSVWDKPPGMLSQGSRYGDHCAAPRYAEKHLRPQRNAFTVHRLDRAASGLMVIAHSRQTAARLSALFSAREVVKRYHVAVSGRLDARGEALVLDTPVDGKPARSRVRTVRFDDAANVSLLEVEIETGRKHQIRAHLAAHGFPVVGDRLYGSSIQSVDLRLRAVALEFRCPIAGENRRFAVETPWWDAPGG
ncbi:MAG: RluA family pseudouridine synthase [Pseudomonadota bacterium]